MIPAVAKVPKIPSVKIGPAATRKRRQPTSVPPLKRMTISATTPMRSTSRIERRSPSRGKMSEATAARRRKITGSGTGNRLADLGQEQGQQEPARDDEHDCSEDGELVHKTSLNAGRDNGFLTDR